MAQLKKEWLKNQPIKYTLQMEWTQNNTAYSIEWTTDCTYDVEINYTLKN